MLKYAYKMNSLMQYLEQNLSLRLRFQGKQVWIYFNRMSAKYKPHAREKIGEHCSISMRKLKCENYIHEALSTNIMIIFN